MGRRAWRLVVHDRPGPHRTCRRPVTGQRGKRRGPLVAPRRSDRTAVALRVRRGVASPARTVAGLHSYRRPVTVPPMNRPAPVPVTSPVPRRSVDDPEVLLGTGSLTTASTTRAPADRPDTIS